MPEDVSLSLSPREAAGPEGIHRALARTIGRSVAADRVVVIRRSVDARQRPVRVNLGVRIYGDGETLMPERPVFAYRDVRSAAPVVVVGAGPAGLFAALRLVELGLKPVVVDRGKPVKARRRDVAALNRRGVLDSESNYAFGEGGAGTFSDGKLYTRSKKRGDHRRVLHRFHQHGADGHILYDARPHIGSNRLTEIVSAMRATIEAHGGEIHFQQKVVGLSVSGGRATGVLLADGHPIEGRAVVLATGHSARDVYQMLMDHKIDLEAKPFAMGVRVEHPQKLIDRIQYHGQPRGEYLPAAEYSLAHQVDGRGVYSFCMCPGGFIVPASTQDDTLVINGMSFSKRNSPYANAGIVVEIRLADVPRLDSSGPLAGLNYQRAMEQAASVNGGGGVIAPAQRATTHCCLKGFPPRSVSSDRTDRGFSATQLDVLYTMKVNVFGYQQLDRREIVVLRQRLIAALLLFQFQPAGGDLLVLALLYAQGIEYRHGVVPGLVVEAFCGRLALQRLDLGFQRRDLRQTGRPAPAGPCS